MLKSFGFFIPWKVALSLVEIPLVGCLALGAALLESSHGNLGSWLWLSDFGAADPTYLSPLLFFLSVSARVMVCIFSLCVPCLRGDSYDRKNHPAWDVGMVSVAHDRVLWHECIP